MVKAKPPGDACSPGRVRTKQGAGQRTHDKDGSQDGSVQRNGANRGYYGSGAGSHQAHLGIRVEKGRGRIESHHRCGKEADGSCGPRKAKTTLKAMNAPIGRWSEGIRQADCSFDQSSPLKLSVQREFSLFAGVHGVTACSKMTEEMPLMRAAPNRVQLASGAIRAMR